MKECFQEVKVSSNIISGIKAVLFIYFFYEKISHAQKAQKRTQVNKSKKGSFKCA